MQFYNKCERLQSVREILGLFCKTPLASEPFHENFIVPSAELKVSYPLQWFSYHHIVFIIIYTIWCLHKVPDFIAFRCRTKRLFLFTSCRIDCCHRSTPRKHNHLHNSIRARTGRRPTLNCSWCWRPHGTRRRTASATGGRERPRWLFARRDPDATRHGWCSGPSTRDSRVRRRCRAIFSRKVTRVQSRWTDICGRVKKCQLIIQSRWLRQKFYEKAKSNGNKITGAYQLLGRCCKRLLFTRNVTN